MGVKVNCISPIMALKNVDLLCAFGVLNPVPGNCCPAKLSSNYNQTNLKHLIKVVWIAKRRCV